MVSVCLIFNEVVSVINYIINYVTLWVWRGKLNDSENNDRNFMVSAGGSSSVVE